MNATLVDRMRSEAGVTLVELVIAIMLLGIIIVPLTASFIFGIRATSDSTERLNEARSPLFTSAYFADDAQSATTISDAAAPPAGVMCGTGTNVISFNWTETPVSGGAPTTYKVSYVITGTGADQKLVRQFCAGTAPVSTSVVAPVLAATANPVTVRCAGAAGAPVACSSKPATITLEASLPRSQPFTVTGTRRTTT